MPSDAAALAAAAAAVLAVLAEAVRVRCLAVDHVSPLQDDPKPAQMQQEFPLDTASAARPPSVAAPCEAVGPCAEGSHSNTRDGQNEEPSPARVLVLFSGGVDSTLLAALTHQVPPPPPTPKHACACTCMWHARMKTLSLLDCIHFTAGEAT